MAPRRRLKNPLIHHNVESLSRYIRKHDEYSNWEARVWLEGEQNCSELAAGLLRNAGPAPAMAAEEVFRASRFAVLFFLYKYVLRWDFWMAFRD